jgi:hypothetical protein
MTVIAYDGEHVAADTYIVNDSGLHLRTRKIEVFEDKVLATSGAADHGEALVVWFKMGRNPATFPHAPDRAKDAYLYVFQYEKPVVVFQTWPAPILFPVTEFTAGCGGEIARAALKMGRHAMGAAALACELNVFCGGDVEYVDLRDLAGGGGEVLVYDHD